MKTLWLSVGAGLALACAASGQTVQTDGAGSAVTVVDRVANFDRLSVNGTAPSDYTEGQLFIGTNADSWVGTNTPPLFDPFHGANAPDRAFYFPDGGSQGWTVIRTTDAKLIYGVEFMYGNGWTTGDIYGVPWGNHNAVVEWQSMRGGSVASSGTTFMYEMGTILAWSDPAGFSELWVKCTSATSADPTLQALALDKLKVQITVPPALCYANCDGSTVAPILNANDFQCFLNSFAAGDPYANCDGSTVAPVLNANDFQCFLNQFAIGCP